MARRTLEGHATAASNGVAIGQVQKLGQGRQPIPERRLKRSEIASELQRLKRAVERALEEVDREYEHLSGFQSKDPQLILEAHRMMLIDPELIDNARQLIKERQINAEWALRLQMDRIKAVFDTIEDDYLRERKIDVEQAGQRILQQLMGQSMGFSVADTGPLILISYDFSPTEVVSLWRLGVAGIVTEQGGINAHSIIVARSIGLPALVGTTQLFETAEDGDMLIIDAERNRWMLNPSEKELENYRKFSAAMEVVQEGLHRYAGMASISTDGKPLPIMANLQFKDELEQAHNVGAEGVGLFRTEFLFMQGEEPPDEETQYDHYVHVVRGMRGRPVSIRLLDIGGDKPGLFQKYADHHSGDNPAMGMRGIRLLLKWPEGLRTQLRAILRAAEEGPVNIVIPMVTSIDEVLQVREAVEAARRELATAAEVKIGAMIEVPAAVLIADALAVVCDFFSIGSNDLIQYTLAADRSDEEVSRIYQPNHPAILQLLQMTVDAAKRAGIPVSICGELAADPEWTQLFLDMGMDSLSMGLHNILRIRRHLSRLEYHAADHATL